MAEPGREDLTPEQRRRIEEIFNEAADLLPGVCECKLRL